MFCSGVPFMADDVLLNKAAVIERCLKRVAEEYDDDPKNLRRNFTKQDSIVLNLERACEAAIDIAMRLVKIHRLGLPQENREAFDLLFKAGKIPTDLCRKLKAMVGFRNVAIHDYQAVNLDIVESILKKDVKDLARWARFAIKTARQ